MAGRIGPYKRLTVFKIGPNARARSRRDHKLWITYYRRGIDVAIRLGDWVKHSTCGNQYCGTPRVMFLRLKGKHELARKLTKNITHWK